MKDIIALLWGISVIVVAIYLTATGKFNRSGLGILSAAAILGGLAIANYDIVKRFEGLGVKVETARQEIGTAKDEALAQIKTEVEGHKQSIELLIRSENDTNEKLGQQKTALTNLIIKAESLDHQIQLDQTNLDVVKLMITDPTERQKFDQELMNSLPH